MKIVYGIAASAVLCVWLAALPSEAMAQWVEPRKLSRVVKRGETVTIAARTAVDGRNCVPGPAPSFRPQEAPKLGELTSKDEIHELTEKTRGHSGCVGVKAPATQVYYTAGKVPGKDRATFFFIRGPMLYPVELDIEVR